MRGSDFIFDCVPLLYYKCHKINVKLGGSCINFNDQIKNEKAIINFIHKKYNKCFQYAITVQLNYEKHSERILKIKPFIDKFNLEGIDYPL